MKKAQNTLAISLVAFSALSLSGCFGKKKGGDTPAETATFAFSVGLASNASTIEMGTTKESIAIYDNGIDTANRSYTFEAINPEVATIDASTGKITTVAPGRANFRVTESSTGISKKLKREIVVTPSVSASAGGYNFSGGTRKSDLERRIEILGQLEKYVMDTHLTGLTLFENGGLVKYSSRVKIPTAGKQYISGYGFGILTDGELDGTLSGTNGGNLYQDFYHSSISQDSLKINQYSATGSQVSDLAGYISSSYWSTRMNSTKNGYDWYPLLAADTVDGQPNNEPIPNEPYNSAELYKKWRIYVKTDGVRGVNLKYTARGSLQSNFNNLGVTIDDYEFVYQLLFTGSNNIIRGTEMANDTSYGIKGAQRFFNDTKNITDAAQIQAKWDEFKAEDKLGISTGFDSTNGHYIDIELINPIDSFTAMYTLSSNLTSPLPKSLFVGSNAIAGTIKDSIKAYGTFNGESRDDAILDYTICLGAYTLTKWEKEKTIVFERNNNWFETPAQGGNRYKIPGVYFNVIDTSNDSNKNWKYLNNGDLDSAGVPSDFVKDMRGTEGVYETKGDATFKLNINSCTEEQWLEKFGPNGSIKPQTTQWNVKPWMSNSDFLDGIFYSIDRQAFAEKRGVNPSTDYFSNAYQNATSSTEPGIDDVKGSYNGSNAHKNAVKGYSEDYGYNFDKATDCFRNAVSQLAAKNKLTLGPDKDHPTEISIQITWMYTTDEKEYGNDIVYYIEKAFNDLSVCGGRVKLSIKQDHVTNWEDVYNEVMMKGQYDLAFGAISGNTYNPLNFLEVLKSDNSSEFTLNWGADTSKIDDKNAIIYNGQKWSFDALWEVSDHGGIVKQGEKIKPVKYCNAGQHSKYEGTGSESNLYNGYKVEFPVEFNNFDGSGSGDIGKAEFDVNRMDIYVHGYGNVTLATKGSSNLTYDKVNNVIRVTVTPTVAEEINNAIKSVVGAPTAQDPWKANPFIISKLGKDSYDGLFNYELYYELSISGGSSSINYYPVELSNN